MVCEKILLLHFKSGKISVIIFLGPLLMELHFLSKIKTFLVNYWLLVPLEKRIFSRHLIYVLHAIVINLDNKSIAVL